MPRGLRAGAHVGGPWHGRRRAWKPQDRAQRPAAGPRAGGPGARHRRPARTACGDTAAPSPPSTPPPARRHRPRSRSGSWRGRWVAWAAPLRPPACRRSRPCRRDWAGRRHGRYARRLHGRGRLDSDQSWRREPGRAGLPQLELQPGGGAIWDGRFHVRLGTAARGCRAGPCPAAPRWRNCRRAAHLTAGLPRSAAATLPSFWRAGRLIAVPWLAARCGYSRLFHDADTIHCHATPLDAARSALGRPDPAAI